ncbi:MAG: FlgD immunoglobulin-like domain containing protein [Bacteroidota bacterium]
MVAKLNKIKPRCLTRHRVWQARCGWAALAAALFFLTYNAQSQDFLNAKNGTYKGPGLFQVKGQAIGLPDTVTGTFEYFGTDSQQIGAKNYENLLLTGNGSTKKTTINNVNILRTVAVTNGVKLDIASTMTLEKITGRITNESGLIVGKVKKIVDLNNTTSDSSDFGGIGASISWNGTNPGLTTITRTSGTALSINGKSSIQRFFDINTTTDTSLNAKLFFTYGSSELQGQNPSSLDLWRSPDSGVSWRRQRVDRIGNILTRSNIPSFGPNGRWTAADANHLLGIANYEWETDSLKLIAGNNQHGRVRKQSDTAFVARVVDAFNQSLRGQNVQFAIIDNPLGATGQTLSATSATSDASGQVQTKITFGSLKGNYRVLAFVPGVPTTIDTFMATANTSIASLMIAQIPRTSDSVLSVIAPIVFVAKDQDSLTVSQTPIAFKINGPDTNYRADKDTVITDANGKASVNITFGKKSGSVIVSAFSIEDPSVKTSIDLNATPGTAAKINNILVGGLAQDTVMKVKQFVINLFDSELNPKQGDTVLISLTKQSSSVHDSLLTPFIIIDTNKTVLASVRLGEKVGTYTLTARAKNNVALSSSQVLTAIPDVPAKMIAGANFFEDTIGTVIPQLSALLSDKYDNSISNALVRYSTDTTIAGTADSAIVHTDITGKASNRFTIGTKAGTYNVYATLNGLQDTFKITVKPGIAQNILVAGGLGQGKEILQPLDSVFTVRLTDRAGNSRPNDTVFFAITDTPLNTKGVSLSNTLAITDVNGFASTRLTLGDKVGSYKIKASSRRLSTPVELVATAMHGSAKTLVYQMGRGQQQQILKQLDTAFVVQIRDIGGNPIPSKSVQFVIDTIPTGAWGYALTDSVSITDSSGYARTWLKFGSKIGTYGVSAKSTALSYDTTIRFSARAYHGIAKILAHQSGNGQVGQIGDTLNPFIVLVSDTGGNAVPSTQVAFSILPHDTLAKHDTLTVFAATTDSNGYASTSLVLGNKPGQYTVKASAAGVKDTIFVARAIILYADVNHDNYRNIGDLTAIIDHVLGRKLLTGYEFINADMYPRHADGTVGDGIVDIRDVQVCLDSLLKNGWNPTCNYLQSNVGTMSKVEGGSVPLTSGSTFLTSKTDSCYVQTTYIGSRFSLKNTIPIKGLQAVIYMKNTASLDTTDIIFSRASMMKANVKSVGKEVSVILWNVNNSPIEPGDSAIFRLPIQLTNNNIDSIHVLMSSGSNNEVLLLNSMQEDIRNSIPRDWMLYQNYPNPFNPTTTIEFDVPEVAGKIPRVAVQIFNILGQKIKTLEHGIHDTGRDKVIWNGTNENGVRVASGVYFYRLLAGEYASTKKMVMLK